MSLVVAAGSMAAVHAQPAFNLDPSVLINDYVSLGEFNTEGELEGWGRNAGAVQTTVVNGVMRVTTTSGDPWFFRAGIPGLSPDFNLVQVRLRVLKGERSGWEMFWGQTGATGFSGGRRIGYVLDFEDSEYHVLEYDMSPVLDGGSLTDFRIDCGQNAGNVIEVDYVRVGRVSPDSDGDGLPDTVETGTGVFVDARDTGTQPNLADSDKDGVPDGVEVTFGTDPNDPSVFPVPSIDRYSENPATYIVGVSITANAPTVSNGTTTGFQISPSLPAGLNFSTATGQITGTPTAAKDLTEYTVTATFSGGKTAVAVLKIEVRNPYIDYTVATRAMKRDIPIAPFSPNVYGPAPTSYAVSPDLPEGLVLDTTVGEISGTPATISKLTSYTVSASYPDGLKAETPLEIAIVTDPVPTTDPEKTVVEYFSMAEFAEQTEADAFFRNSVDPLVILDGVATVTTTGGDPFFGRSNLVLENDYRILEFRMRVVQGGSPLRFYWAEDAPGRGFSEATAWTLPPLSDDGLYHVYQVDFTDSLLGAFNALRLDPGDGAGSSLEVDYIRIGSLVAAPKLTVALQSNGKVRISWPAGAAGVLQSTSKLPGGWAAEPAAVSTEGNQKFIEIQPAAAKFFRLVN